MGRKRVANPDLAPGMYKTPGGTHYCFNASGDYVGLGRDYVRACTKFAEMTQPAGTTWTVSKMLDGYLGLLPEYRSVVSAVKRSDQLAPITHKKNLKQARYLRAFFGHMHPGDVNQQHIYKYMAERGAPIAANRDKSLLLSAFNWGISIGIPGLLNNPCRGVVRFTETPQSTEVTDAMFLEAYNAPNCPQVIRCAMDIVDMMGLRPTDVRLLNDAQHCTPEGIRVRPNKTAGTTGKRNRFPWTPELHALRERCAALAKNGVRSVYWLCTRQGQPYTADGLRAIWTRFMRDAVKAGYVRQRFRFYDIRGRAGDRSEEAGQAGNKLLANDRKTFERNYQKRDTVVHANPPTRGK